MTCFFIITTIFNTNFAFSKSWWGKKKYVLAIIYLFIAARVLRLGNICILQRVSHSLLGQLSICRNSWSVPGICGLGPAVFLYSTRMQNRNTHCVLTFDSLMVEVWIEPPSVFTVLLSRHSENTLPKNATTNTTVIYNVFLIWPNKMNLWLW